MVQDSELTKAVASIPQRSEKQTDVQKLVVSFVDVGILPQVNNINSQIIYGRRGTGKTHVMRVLASTLSARDKTAVIYVDARILREHESILRHRRTAIRKMYRTIPRSSQ